MLRILFILFPLISHARWADVKEATYAINFQKIHYKIKKDGSYTALVEIQTEILKDSARQQQGLRRLQYNEKSGTFHVLQARTINGEKSINVPRKNIEVKPLASRGQGFDVQMQVTLGFLDVNIGSKLYVKYEMEVKNPPVPGLFYNLITLGTREYVQSFEYSFSSEVPLYYEIRDPEKSMEVVASENSLSIHSKAAVFRSAVEEQHALFDRDSLFWIGVSTAKNWQDLPKKTIATYEETMNSALPEKLAEIEKRASEKTSAVDQINTVTSNLADTVRYVGDWRLVKGAFHPHSLSNIATNAYGDCKDFSVSAGAILRKLGFDVHVAWILRGKDEVLSPLKIVVPYINHAILYAKKDNQEFWIDPTNTSSFAQGIYEDIEDRPAIVLFPEGAQLRQVPAIKVVDSDSDVRMELDFTNAENIVGQGEMTVKGNAIVQMTGKELSFDKQSLDYSLVTWATGRQNLSSWNLGNYNLKSRIVSDFKTDFHFLEPWHPIMTSAGHGYSIPEINYIEFFKIRNTQRVTALEITNPAHKHQEYLIKGRNVYLPKDLECKGSSDWADFSRHIYKKSSALIVSDDFTLKVKSILPEVIGSKEFSDFQQRLTSCMQNTILIFQ